MDGDTIEAMEPAGVDDAAAPLAPIDTGKTHDTAAELDQLLRFEAQARIPSWAQPIYDNLPVEREYIHTGIFTDVDASADDLAVTTNWLLRNQQTKLARMMPTDPDWQVKPKKVVGNPKPETAGFADTAQVLLSHLWAQATGTELVQGALQDRMTSGLVWLKGTWSEDLTKDPVGRRLPSDEQDQVLRLRRLAEEYAAGEWDDTDGRYAELIELGDYAIAQAQGQQAAAEAEQRQVAAQLAQLAGLPMQQPIPPDLAPEARRWRGVVIDVMQAEHVRLDWWITAPERWRESSHVTFMHYLPPEEVAERWGLSIDEARALGNPTATTGIVAATNAYLGPHLANAGTQDDPSQATAESRTKAGTVLVYERWDRALNRVFVWAQGVPRFLANYIPKIVSSQFFPCVPLYANRVSGRFFPLSDTQLQKALAVELNQLATEDRAARYAAFNRFLITKGLLSDPEKRKLARSRPHEVVEAERAGEVAKEMQIIVGSPYRPDLTNRDRAMNDMQAVSGLPPQANGMTGDADFAAEVEVAAQNLGAQSGMSQEMLRRALRAFGRMILEYAAIAMPPDEVQEICGDGATWPLFDREALLNGMDVDVQVGVRGAVDKEKEVGGYVAIVDLVVKLNAATPGMDPLVLDKPRLFAECVRAMDMRTSAKELAVPMSALAQSQAQQQGAAAGMAPGAVAPALPAPVPAPDQGQPIPVPPAA